MSLKNALMGFKKQLEDKATDEKIAKMLEEQALLLSPKKPIKEDKVFDENVLVNGGETHYNYDSKWYKVSVHTSDECLFKKYKYHCRNALGYRVFVSAKSYIEAQSVIDEMIGVGYSVSASSV